MSLERRTPLARSSKPMKRVAMKQGRKPLRSASDAKRDDADRRAEVRLAVFTRDRFACVVAPWARTTMEWWQDGDHRIVIVPACGGLLEFAHRRHASAGGAYVEANGNTMCHQHNSGFMEDYPDAARALGGETPWWLVVREGDPEWEALGRKAAGAR